ncbi:MAG: hypothetical protein LQ338_007726 [Usnochroma carphineum]|nr:MAG: hypothetical protein LQ338_007726 [Usnochroma carphineum]
MAPSCTAMQAPMRVCGHHNIRWLGCFGLDGPAQCTNTRVAFPAPRRRGFHTSNRLSSSLFNLGGLSTSRESQYLAKERGIPRTEFSPHLELIRSSEVDTQRAPGSSKAPMRTAVPKTTISGSSASSGLITIPDVVYSDFKSRIKKLEEQLAQSEKASRQLLTQYQKRMKEGMILGGVCLLLALAVLYAEETQKLKTLALQAWRTGRQEQAPAQESLEIQTRLLGSESAEKLNTMQDTPAFHRTSECDAESKQPWTFSRLFWAAKD